MRDCVTLNSIEELKIEKTWQGFQIRATEAGKHYWLVRICNKKPVWCYDYLYAHHYKTMRTAENARNVCALNGLQIKKAEAVYTGGGIYLFYGELENGLHFLTDDMGATLVLDASAENFDESLYEDWQSAHQVEELTDEARRTAFVDILCDYLKEHDRGMTDYELEKQRAYMKEPI
jgi:hypothetical protein